MRVLQPHQAHAKVLLWLALAALLSAACAGAPLLKRRPDGEAVVSALSMNISLEGPLSSATIDEFNQKGWVHIEQIIDQHLIRDALAAVDGLVDSFAHDMLAAGRTSSAYAELPTDARLLRIREEDPDAIILLIKRGIMPAEFATLSEHPALVKLMQQLTGSQDIAAHVAWNLRIKMPDMPDAEVPWHQDNSYWEPWTWSKPIFSAWLPLVRATRENGCLEFVAGSHRSGRTFAHSVPFQDTWYTVMTDEAWADLRVDTGKPPELVVVPASPGDVIAFPGTTAHRSLPNTASGTVRWSLDFRFHPASQAGGRKGSLDWFYGVKDSLLLTNSTDPFYKPDWKAWAGVDRNAGQDKQLAGAKRTALNLDKRNGTSISENTVHQARKRVVSLTALLGLQAAPSIPAAFDSAKEEHYDGLELNISDIRMYFKSDASTEFIVDALKQEIRRTSVAISGSVYDFAEFGVGGNSGARMRSAVGWAGMLGAEYIVLSMASYHGDATIEYVRKMQSISLEFGLNFYLWNDRISVDGVASSAELDQFWDVARGLAMNPSAHGAEL